MELFGTPLDARLAVVAVAVVIGGFMRGFVGFGGALVIVPVLSLAFGPKTAVAATSIMGLPAMLQLLPEAVRFSERPVVVPVGLATLLATPIGSWILVAADPGLMKIVISGLVVSMAAMLAVGWRPKREVGLAGLITAGVAGGLVQGSAGIGGPPVVAVALSRPGTAKAQRANVLALMTAITVSSFAPLLSWGLFTREALAIGILLLPVYLAATALGSRYFAQGGQRHFRGAALATLAAVGLGTLVAAIWRYLE